MSAEDLQETMRIEAQTTLAQFDACVELQNTVWNYDLTGMMTQKVFLLASQIGGQVIGGFAGERLAGYAMSLPGIRDGRAYLHSHHLAVLPEFRNAGLGRQLKLSQRSEALARGIGLMEWTFDPLEIKNAHLNFARLGAVSRRYRRNFYGSSNSPLHGGLPTDRIVAEWWLDSKRVRNVLAGRAPVVRVVETVMVPHEVAQWKMSDAERPLALEVQQRNADALEAAFARGLAVVGYTRTASGDGVFQLGECDENL